MREKTNEVTQGYVIKGMEIEMKSGLIHERMVRVTHTYELDRSEEGIA